MSVNNVNGLTPNVNVKPNVNVQPKEQVEKNLTNPQNTSPSSDTFEKQGLTKKQKIAIGTGITAAIVAGAILIYKNIKKGKPISLEDFTKMGNKFENGVALKPDGSKFSGTITHTGKNGDKFVIEYADGALKKSTKNVSKNGAVGIANGNYIKEYTRDAEGKLVNVKKTVQGLDDFQNVKETIISDRKITQIENGKIKNETLTPIGEKYANQAQREYMQPFQDKLSNKSAKNSASVFEDAFRDEAMAKIEAEEQAKINAEIAQGKYNKPFEENLSNKSAKESASAFEEVFNNNEAKARVEAEKQAKINVENAQQKYNKPFEENLSNKSAKESAEVFEEHIKAEEEALEKLQEPFNKPFEEKLSNKSAKESAEVFEAEDDIEWSGIEADVTKGNKGAIEDEPIKTFYSGFENNRFYMPNPEAHGYMSVDYTTKFADGTSSRIVYEAFDHKTCIDSQGRVLQYADWYVKYRELCQEYGVAVRECGTKGGAGDHYFELLVRDKGDKAWNQYLRNEAQKMELEDAHAQLMNQLRAQEKGYVDLIDIYSTIQEMGYVDLAELTKIAQENGYTNLAELVRAAREKGCDNLVELVKNAEKMAQEKLRAQEYNAQVNYVFA